MAKKPNVFAQLGAQMPAPAQLIAGAKKPEVVLFITGSLLYACFVEGFFDSLLAVSIVSIGIYYLFNYRESLLDLPKILFYSVLKPANIFLASGGWLIACSTSFFDALLGVSVASLGIWFFFN